MDDSGDTRDHLRLASSRPLSLINGERTAEAQSGPSASESPRPALTSIAVHFDGDWISATATLALNGRVLNGSSQGDAAERTAIVATATLNAVSGLLDAEACIEKALIIDVDGRDVALTIIRLDAIDTTDVLVGSALVRGDNEDATARSVLSALNRRLTR